MRVCYFGTYSLEEGYPRNRVIIEGLKRNGIDVIECHEDLWSGTQDKLSGVRDGFSSIKKLFRIFRVYLKLIRKYLRTGSCDAVIVGYAGHLDIFLAKFLNLSKKKPLLFDVFLSLYDTAVEDRKILPPASIRAKFLHLIDKWSCRMADAVLLDTPAHIDYFVREFGLPAGNFHAIPVGSSLPVNRLTPGHADNNRRFNILYFGSYIPLHGVDVILKAAKILQDRYTHLQRGGGEGNGAHSGAVTFTLAGAGQTLQEMKGLASGLELKNVTFIDRFVKEDELSGIISSADICLGIFANTNKALRVIPCKVYNCLAAGKPLITARTPATDGVLTHNENVYFCNAGDPESLADAVVALKEDDAARNRIAWNGVNFFNKNFSADVIGRKVVEIINAVAGKQEQTGEKIYSGARKR